MRRAFTARRARLSLLGPPLTPDFPHVGQWLAGDTSVSQRAQEPKGGVVG